eukprot:10968-Rhodomonas_salina.4
MGAPQSNTCSQLSSNVCTRKALDPAVQCRVVWALQYWRSHAPPGKSPLRMPYALCPMPYALCSMLYALSPILFHLHPIVSRVSSPAVSESFFCRVSTGDEDEDGSCRVGKSECLQVERHPPRHRHPRDPPDRLTIARVRRIEWSRSCDSGIEWARPG